MTRPSSDADATLEAQILHDTVLALQDVLLCLRARDYRRCADPPSDPDPDAAPVGRPADVDEEPATA
jgi:hypothetical protein